MRIEPLLEQTLQPALDLIYAVFENKPEDDDYPGYWLPESLKRNPPVPRGPFAPSFNVYWVALENDAVIGIVGLYQPKEDSQSYWLGWFAVAPSFRGKGVGKKLLEFAIQKTKDAGKKSLKLYTSDEPNEAAAQILYEKLGFQEIKRIPKKEYVEIIREKVF